MKKEIAVKYMRLIGGWIRIVDMEDDLGINMKGSMRRLNLDGRLDYETRLGANYKPYKVWRLR